MFIDEKAIVNRGYTTTEEYQQMLDEKDRTIRVSTEEKDETFWGISFKTPEYKKLFILANTPIDFFRAPRDVCGMVAVRNNNIMIRAESIEKFKVAGQPAIDYWKSECEKYKEKDKGKI